MAKVHRDGLDLAGDADGDGALMAADLRLIVLMSQGSAPVIRGRIAQPGWSNHRR